ncbi:MAG: DNA ligase D [Pseudolabrys sp.]
MAELKTYRAKRRFDATSEPHGKLRHSARTKRGHAYVIQKHDATRLHYDLRLELDGVMKSWAVTRGPSLNPDDKRLAVEVEDHPIEYNKFEGTIPKGQYGGGTVMIWDRGSWEPNEDPHRGLKKGHLTFRLDGEKLQGDWHLVRMHKRQGEKRNNWLLIKTKDDEARGAKGKDILKELPLSAVSGRDLDEIAAGGPTRKATGKRKPAAKVRKTKSAALRATTPARRSTPLPDFVEPALATLADKAPEAANWVHEIKFDGYRLQARLDHGRVKLLTRRGLDWTAKFTPIADRIARLRAESALLDGELVVEDENGVSSFSLLQLDLKEGRTDRMTFYAFDLLHLDGHDIRKLPLGQRKAQLSALLGRDSKSGQLRMSESLDESGPVLHKHACRMGLEGIISKRDDTPYRSGRGHDWLKIKCSDRQEFVIAGFVPSTADRHAIGALALGYYEAGKLHYAGRVGTGYTNRLARDLFKKLKAIRQDRTPFRTVPVEERGKNGALWVEPKYVGEVAFHGWTHGERVRQASFQGLREDKPAKDIARERKFAAATRKSHAKRSNAKRSNAKPATKAKGIVDDRVGKVRLTHPDRVYWEDAGVTKRDLADYYAATWDWMRPHLVDRVIAIVRCPEGAAGQCFFQKHASAGIEAKFLRLVKEPDGDKSIAVRDLDGLIALAQAGALEIHVRGSSAGHLEHADRLVFDLDPGPGVDWADIIAAARDVRERLAGIKLRTFAKTSGGKGLHVVLPIKPTPWEKAKDFCRAVAEAMAADSPDKYVANATKAKRPGRIFIDYLRNSREATAVAPYSTRARPGAPVAVPIDWSELGKLKSADQYTVLNLAQRLDKLRKDPWDAMAKLKQTLPQAKR